MQSIAVPQFDIRKGKLAHYWHAATNTEQVFRRMYRAQLLARISISNDCDLMKAGMASTGDNEEGANLYVWSQLAYGATRVLTYQVDDLLRDCFKCVETLEGGNAAAKRQTSARSKYTSTPSELTISMRKGQRNRPVTRIYNNTNIDLHEVYEDLADYNNQVNSEDLLDFGKLTDNELGIIDSNESLLTELVEVMRIGQLEMTTDSTAPAMVPPDLTAVSAGEETVVESAAPLEAQKLHLTPAKMSTAASSSHVFLPELSMNEAEIVPLTAPQSSPIKEITRENVSEISRASTGKPAKRKKRFDRTKTLSGQAIRAQLSNIYIHTVDHAVPPIQIKSPNRLLKTAGCRCGRTLSKLFADWLQRLGNILNTPITEASSELVLEAVRSEENAGLEKSVELSSAIPGTLPELSVGSEFHDREDITLPRQKLRRSTSNTIGMPSPNASNLDTEQHVHR